jgi:prepilin-type N-terminal cleavage/methylation domain-containing protein
MSRERGYSLPEMLVALLILTIVMTVSMAAFIERNKRLRLASETILAYQALSNEAEYWRRIDYDQLTTTPPVFRSDVALLAPLEAADTSIRVDTIRTGVRNVTMTVRWKNGQRQAQLSLLRVDTGGTNLW